MSSENLDSRLHWNDDKISEATFSAACQDGFIGSYRLTRYTSYVYD